MNKYSATRNHSLRAVCSVVGLPMALAACGPAAPPPGFNADARLVFPRTTQSITVDGAGPIGAFGGAGDAAWEDSFKFELEQGAMDSAATLRGVATESDLYLYVQAEDESLDGDDAFVLAINPDGANPNFHRFVIFPCAAVCPGAPDTKSTNITPAVQYYAGSKLDAGVAWPAMGGAVPAGIQIKAAAANAGVGAPDIWSVEIKIPRTALGGFNENWMGLFADAIVVDQNAGPAGDAIEYSWPTGLALSDVLTTPGGANTVPVAQWGLATLSTALGNGVSVMASEFGSNQSDPSNIFLGAGNSFHAYAVNNQSTGGTLVAAEDVTATFSIANNGLGMGWTNIPPPGDAVDGPADIPAAGAHLFETGLWNLTPAQIAQYTANPNQCVKVTLTSSNPNTVITQATAQKNMRFVNVNSPFEGTNVLSLRGFERLASRKEPGFVLRERFYNLEKDMKWQTRLAGAEQIGEHKWLAPIKSEEGQLGVWVSPDDRLRLPADMLALKPGTGAKGTDPLTYAVRPGSVVTLIADGSIQMGDMPISAGGITPASLRAAGKEFEDRGPFAEGRPQRYGVVLGSFDDFRTHFVIGNGATVRVPDNARRLSVIINDGENGYAMQKGKGFAIRVVSSAITDEMRARFPELSMKNSKNPNVLLPLGANLPTWVVRGELITDRFIVINGRRYRVHMPAGSFGYWVKSVGERQIGTVRPRPGPNTTTINGIRPGIVRDTAVIRRDGPN